MNSLPFGVHSVIPELANIPKLRNMQQKDEAPATLRLSEESRKAVNLHIDTTGLERKKYEYTVKDQQKALEDLGRFYLHLPVQEERDVQSKLAIQTTTSKAFGGKLKDTHPWKRFTRIYQCQCGVDNSSGHNASEKRQMPWKEVGCLFWVRLVTTHINGEDGRLLAVDELIGMLDHSDECALQIEMDRNPRLPLNTELRNFALDLLRKPVPLSLLRSECLSWAEKRWPGVVGDNHSRFRLTSHDTSSLYRSISQECGIPQRSAAEENLDLWFRAEKPRPPSPLLTTACLHYQPHRLPESDRFEIILSTPEMQAAAWKFGHKKQVLMDLTFGVCSARTLLLILLAIDDTGTGIPIAFILFTARPDAQAVHADYNTQILDNLLAKFKASLGTNAVGEAFEIAIGNTDNDARERAALSSNWPDIQLLLCIFHVWQCWKNALNRHLKCIPKGDERKATRSHLGALLARLMREITLHEDAISALQVETQYWEKMSRKRNPSSKTMAKGALAFLGYLSDYVTDAAFWRSWSLAGAIDASKRLNVPLKNIARTNNHLESFNGRIKGKYLKPFHHSGRLPRIDTWILVVVTDVMPNFFQERFQRLELDKHYASLRQIKPGPPKTSLLDSRLPDTPPFPQADDTLISTWIQELEAMEDDDLSDTISESESQSPSHIPPPSSPSPQVVSTSMSYDESSRHPDPMQLFFEPHNHSPPSSVIDDSEDQDSILGSLNLEPGSPPLRYRSLVNIPQDTSQELSPQDMNTIASKMIEITQAQDLMLSSMQTILRIAPNLRQQLEPFISSNICMRIDLEDTASSDGSISSSSIHPGHQNTPIETVPEGQLVPFVPANKEATKKPESLHTRYIRVLRVPSIDHVI